MAVCDPLGCKFYKATPCCEEKSGACGICFCCCSKPRCRFCKTLYDQQIVLPFHWCKSGRKVDYVGDAEKHCVAMVMPIASKLLAWPVFFLAAGSAYCRRDVNQAFKGFVNFALFSVGAGSLLILGPFALIFILMMFLSDPIIDWFFMGRCDDCYEFGCSGCCCCFGSTKVTDTAEDAKEVSLYKKVKTKEFAESAEPPQRVMEEATEVEYKRALESERDAEGGSPVCMCCCFILLAVAAGVWYTSTNQQGG